MQDVSIWALMLRLVLSLAVVVALMWTAARVLRGRTGRWTGMRQTAPIEVLGRHTLSRNQSIALIRAADKALVVGITDHTISVLAEADPSVLAGLDDEEAERTRPRPTGRRPGSGSPWTDLLETLREKTVRRS